MGLRAGFVHYSSAKRTWGIGVDSKIELFCPRRTEEVIRLVENAESNDAQEGSAFFFWFTLGIDNLLAA